MEFKDTWKSILNQEITRVINEIDIQEKTLENTGLKILPKRENIFKCFKYFEINETKIVILGQDPYHGDNQATGLCFGVNKKPPPSLKNIIKELKNDVNIDLDDYSLEKWGNQGILLLNSALTVVEGKPGSHIKLWSNFTDKVIEELNKSSNSIIFVAWGAFADNKLKNIDRDKHTALISSHPSPLSVYKKYKTYPSFYGSKPFSKINKILSENNLKEIDW